jgi:excinuclease UvrABC ATPase subunit
MPFKDIDKRKKYASEYNKEWYIKNRKSRMKRIKERKKEIREELKKYKHEKKCEVCREDHPRALDFHHVGDKAHLVSSMVSNGYGITSIMKEIAKCKLLCANCHRLEHYSA